MERYETIEHTADIGIRAYGDSRRELFESAAGGMFAMMADPETVKPDVEFTVRAEAADGVSLLVEWLNELLYVFDSKGVLLKRFEIVELGETDLRARVFGEAIDRSRHALETDIKAATYHMLDVTESGGRWSAQIIFDV